jgi:hypothetical protein
MALDFSQGQDFQGSNLITADHMRKNWFSLRKCVHLCGKITPLEQSSLDSKLYWSRLTEPLLNWRSGEELLSEF